MYIPPFCPICRQHSFSPRTLPQQEHISYQHCYHSRWLTCFLSVHSSYSSVLSLSSMPPKKPMSPKSKRRPLTDAFPDLHIGSSATASNEGNNRGAKGSFQSGLAPRYLIPSERNHLGRSRGKINSPYSSSFQV